MAKVRGGYGRSFIGKNSSSDFFAMIYELIRLPQRYNIFEALNNSEPADFHIYPLDPELGWTDVICRPGHKSFHRNNC